MKGCVGGMWCIVIRQYMYPLSSRVKISLRTGARGVTSAIENALHPRSDIIISCIDLLENRRFVCDALSRHVEIFTKYNIL